MKRMATILLAVLGLLAAACTDDSASTETAGQLSSDAGQSEDDASEDAGSDDDGADESGASDDDAGDAGSDDEGDDGDAGLDRGTTLRSAVLGRALDQSNAMTSASFEGVITIVGQPGSELPGDLTMRFDGAFDTEAQASRVTLDLGGLFEAAMAADPDTEGMEDLFSSMFEDPMEMITIGEQSWVKWGLLAMFGVEDKWLEGDADSASATADFGFGGGTDSPTSMLEDLADASAEVVEVGREDIRGTSTTHYQADLDTEAMASTMSAEERADFESELGASPDATFAFSVWIDDDDLLHRFELSITGLEQVDDAEFQSMTMVYDLWDHGQDPGIVPPPADQVVTEEQLGFSLEDLGGLSG